MHEITGRKVWLFMLTSKFIEKLKSRLDHHDGGVPDYFKTSRFFHHQTRQNRQQGVRVTIVTSICNVKT